MGTRNTGPLVSLFFILWVAGCSPATPATVIVQQTEVVEVPVPVEVTAVAETMPEPVAPASEVTLPRTETITMHSSARDRDYKVYIALPQRYASSTRITYPVVYVLDGDSTFIWATESSRWLSGGGVLPEMIIVGIDNSRQRDQDLLPGREGVEKFLTFIQDELIPYVDGHYRTKPTDRTLVGASNGGLFALFALFHAPDTFNRYVVTTPALSIDDPIFKYEEAYANDHTELPVALFLSVGGRENTRHVKELYDRLASRNYAGLEMDMAIVEGAGHMVTIVKGFIDGLQAVFR